MACLRRVTVSRQLWVNVLETECMAAAHYWSQKRRRLFYPLKLGRIGRLIWCNTLWDNQVSVIWEIFGGTYVIKVVAQIQESQISIEMQESPITASGASPLNPNAQTKPDSTDLHLKPGGCPIQLKSQMRRLDARPNPARNSESSTRRRADDGEPLLRPHARSAPRHSP